MSTSHMPQYGTVMAVAVAAVIVKHKALPDVVVVEV